MTTDALNEPSFTCCLIGGDTLLTQCGELLLERGHSIVQVVTDSPQISRWAKDHEIETVSASSDYSTSLTKLQYDYLFAITHLALIPDEVVSSPAKGAFNFHDGPLPNFAGLNTPMWALLRGASEYAITWHVMTAGIDEGDIVINEEVPISSDDTAVSLNTKCFTAALSSFPRLIDGLVNNELIHTPQDLSQREYFGRADRPGDLSVVDWHAPARSIEQMVRALNTGRYDNPLGVPKLLTEESAYRILSADVVQGDGSPSGAVIETSDSITISCGEDAIRVSQLEDLSGRPVRIQDLNVPPGTTLPKVELDKKLDKEVGVRESYWLRRLKEYSGLALPYRSPTGIGNSDIPPTVLNVELPAEVSSYSLYELAGACGCFLSRVTGLDNLPLAFAGGSLSQQAKRDPRLLSMVGLDTQTFDSSKSAKVEIQSVGTRLQKTMSGAPWLNDLVTRTSAIKENPVINGDEALPVLLDLDSNLESLPNAELTIKLAQGRCELHFMPGAYEVDDMERFRRNLTGWFQELAKHPEQQLSNLSLMTAEERQRLIVDMNNTSIGFDKSQLMHTGFEKIASQEPNKIALVAQDKTITYGDLNHRAELLSSVLRQHGVKPGMLIGVHIQRSIELIVATLGILKSGAAYVPLDPTFPSDRLEFMVEDSGMSIVLSHSSLKQSLVGSDLDIVLVDQLEEQTNVIGTSECTPKDVAYVIYTSGSTGKPKGVVLEHRNVVNFYTAMDRTIPNADQEDRTWMAVTSLSFDISVLELFWTINRGFKVVIHDESSARKTETGTLPRRELDLGLFMWGNDDGEGKDKYKLLMEGARFFDQNGFASIWTPERHFHAFGGPYPNPAVTGAAVAAITENLRIRAGSCVVPLHHPVRIAEEWGVVDNLSNGRVEIAAASGWNPNDFVLMRENHADNKRVMYDQLEQVRQLWRGEKLTFDGPIGPVEVQSLPRPVQSELPCWITTAGNPETWQEAGRLGLNVLTHLLGQSVEEVGSKIKLYREARAEAGFDPQSGRVALMLHTFLGENDEEVKELVREPMKSYLSSSMRLAMDYAWAFPAFKKPGGDNVAPDEVDLKSLSDEEVDTILEFAFERYYETSGLFGSQSVCLSMLGQCAEAGIDEIACLMDFGVETDKVLASLPRLVSLRDAMRQEVADIGDQVHKSVSFADQIKNHCVTHLQCTPSTARMYLADTEARAAYAQVPNLLLGGEALPINLAREIKALNSGNLLNMYGPTETTIWSMSSNIGADDQNISIGTPIANTQIYILDKHRNVVPEGVPGELFIAGDGVARGYLNRPELTAERFLPDPFSDSSAARMYATGDLAAYRSDGSVDYLGRTDFQVKVRGYRIELGEIESRLESLSGVSEAAVVLRGSEDDVRIVAYVVTPNVDTNLDASAVRVELGSMLPDYMIPNEVVTLEYMPRTANGKLDRKALSEIQTGPARRNSIPEDVTPSNELEKTVAELWCKVLKLDVIGVNENFFDLGGHSLLVVQLHNELKQALSQPITLTDLYQYTSVRALCGYLTKGVDTESVKKSVSRGEQRRALRRRRAS